MAVVKEISSGSPPLLDRYEILGPIGSGAAATVFRVRDVRTGAERAAKVLRPDNGGKPEIRLRFEDEFRILRTLHHPHLPEVHDYGRTPEGGRFLVMELVDGEPIDRYFAAHPRDLWVLLYELCEILVFVHGKNLLHQDIKPSNILVTRTAGPGGERPMIKLIDFGLTYRRETGAAVKLVGTAGYIAPEVVRGERTLTRAVDYYSLGATLFELLSGAPPFAGTESEVLRAHLEREPVFEEEKLEWAELYPHVRALLGKEPQARLAAFEDFRRAVVARLTGGIGDLDRAYALARIDSLGMVGKRNAWDALIQWLSAVGTPDARSHTVSVAGADGSGKRYLLDSLRAEAATRGVRTLAPADIDAVRSDPTVARQPALMWSRLLEICEQEPVVLIVERPTTLPDEERSFVRLAGTQWELVRSRGRVMPLFFAVAVDPTTEDPDVLDYLPSDDLLKLELTPLSHSDCEEIVAQFRGSMFDSRDARALATYVGRFEDFGGAIQGLQQAVLRSGLTFVGQRWKAQPSLLGEIVVTKTDQSFGRDLVASLSPTERAVVAIVAAHPDPVPLDWVAEFSDLSPDVVRSIIRGSLKRLCTQSSGLLSPATAGVRASLRAGCDPETMRHAHEFLVARLVSNPRSVTVDQTLAYHHEQLGAVRDAARVHLRLLRTYWGVRPRERPYELIEGVCRSGLELLASHGHTVTAPTRRHLFCFYLKQWINALWARNLFTHARPIIDEWTKRLREPMPSSVAPKYVRSVLELEGPDAALAVASVICTGASMVGQQLKIRLDLERSLCLHNKGAYKEAIALLEAVQSAEYLSKYDVYRLDIYRAMNLEEVERTQEALSILQGNVARALSEGCFDEVILMQMQIARALIPSGQNDECIEKIASALRLARGNGLKLRENALYRIAASAYGELGDGSRVRRCHEKAIQVAGEIGMRTVIGVSWARLSTNERMAGRYGNAIRYADIALSILGETSANRDTSQAWLARFIPHVWLRTSSVDYLAGEMARWISDEAHPEQGFFHYWMGYDLVCKGRYAAALKELGHARTHFELAGFSNNAVWVALQEARVSLEIDDVASYERFIRMVDSRITVRSRRSLHFEKAIVRLRASYLLRSPWSVTKELAEECEKSADVFDSGLAIEGAQMLFRAYARHGRWEAAERAFMSYRDKILDVGANTDYSIDDATEAQAMLKEFRILKRAQEKGAPPSAEPQS
jgi:tRNA A-37 threonylcarbamoyl transferase component Bud32/tetratricopeptide (TPR) repeat protein